MPALTSRLERLRRDLSLALRNLARHQRRALVATASVAFGVAFFIVAQGYMQWMFNDFREATIQSRYAHVQVTRPGFHEDGSADPGRFLLPDDTQMRALADTPGLERLAPRLMLTGLLSRGDTTVSFLAEGIDPTQDQVDDRALTITEGRRLQGRDDDGILIGRGLARMLGARLGDDVVLLVTTPSGGLNGTDARISGIFSSVNQEHEDSSLLMSIDTARRLLRTDGAHAWLLYLDDTAATDQALRQVQSRIQGQPLEARGWEQLAEFYTRAVDLLSSQLEVVRVIVAAIILLGIGNTMMMSVMERTSEIGTSMALGVRRGGVIRQFLIEGGLIGAVGGVVGLALALLAVLTLALLQIEMPPPPGLSRGYVAGISLSPVLALEGLALGVLTTLLASAYPAWKASRLSIVDALRHGR